MSAKGNTSAFSTATMCIQIAKVTKKEEMYYENSFRCMPVVFPMVTILIYQAVPSSSYYNKREAETPNKCPRYGNTGTRSISVLANISKNEKGRRKKAPFEFCTIFSLCILRYQCHDSLRRFELLPGLHDLLIPALFLILAKIGHPQILNEETSLLVISGSIKLIPENGV